MLQNWQIIKSVTICQFCNIPCLMHTHKSLLVSNLLSFVILDNVCTTHTQELLFSQLHIKILNRFNNSVITLMLQNWQIIKSVTICQFCNIPCLMHIHNSLLVSNLLSFVILDNVCTTHTQELLFSQLHIKILNRFNNYVMTVMLQNWQKCYKIDK
jgi:hypothetical protein